MKGAATEKFATIQHAAIVIRIGIALILTIRPVVSSLLKSRSRLGMSLIALSRKLA